MRYINIFVISVAAATALPSNAYYQKIRSAFSLRNFIVSRERAVNNNKYASTKAFVRVGNELHSKERQCIKNRTQKVQSALNNLLGASSKIKSTPRIAVVCSGGGCRATLGTLGALSGLQNIKVLDVISYIAALSGSTWALGLWMSTGMSLPQLKKYVSHRLTNNLYRDTSAKGASLIGHMLAVKTGFKQPSTVVDLFGGFLANNFLHYFGDDRQMVHLSDQEERIINGDFPLPIYTAVDGRSSKIGNAPWYEFTPYEIGSAEYATYVPTWAYGRHFKDGESVDYAPEQSLGFHFGVFGSGFATHAGHMWKRSENKINNVRLRSFVNNIFQYKSVANTRVFWAKIPNFMFGLLNNETNENKQLKLVDAGLECNFPYLPVSGQREERKQDILIFFDFSKSNLPSALKKAEKYARVRGLKFPIIDYTDIEKKTISVFKDENDYL